MTYNVFSGTLNPTHSLTHFVFVIVAVCYVTVFAFARKLCRKSAISSSLKGGTQQLFTVTVLFFFTLYVLRTDS